MRIKNPLEYQLWQTMQAYRQEAVNTKYNFTSEQKKELLSLVDNAEKHHDSIFKLGKTHKALKKYEKLFVEYGGNLDYLCEMVDEFIAKANIDSRLVKAGEIIGNSPGKLRRLSRMKFKRSKDGK